MKKNSLRRHLCFLRCIILGISIHCNINIKNYVFLVSNLSNLGKEIKKIEEGGEE